ncbi:YchJ family protein [Testudinibacter sp. P27/CKL/0425]
MSITLETVSLCPCQSGKQYADCCAPLHQANTFASSAEQLMRSRYAAYVLQQIDYLVQTTVPAQQPQLQIDAMQRWSASTAWGGLTILHHIPKIGKRHAQVEFNAYFRHANERKQHHELSTFVRIGERWYFLDPTTPRPSMKQPCVCGSGKKFKQCCAVFLD